MEVGPCKDILSTKLTFFIAKVDGLIVIHMITFGPVIPHNWKHEKFPSN